MSELAICYIFNIMVAFTFLFILVDLYRERDLTILFLPVPCLLLEKLRRYC